MGDVVMTLKIIEAINTSVKDGARQYKTCAAIGLCEADILPETYREGEGMSL